MTITHSLCSFLWMLFCLNPSSRQPSAFSYNTRPPTSNFQPHCSPRPIPHPSLPFPSEMLHTTPFFTFRLA
ncbi:uncharacterized protein BDZ83DRAFT_619679 [Colletotrichum acutatum]|uniref:Secreted protein n=1 Tax=Glomerella acutata TaxID=27357 RepID=A0AAD8UPD9_GLOAC|nr:uncharacterized protein BDZ83DRAFT_619679 [Colletotrichum acutatum]KAK1725479.1 hypothetical protein BDZ83DRAFT_619679 [Colletotrichum acutatum]